MNLETQFKLINNEVLHQYVRTNSYWYKKLNRDPGVYNSLVKEMKSVYKLNVEDKIENFVDRLKFVQMFMDAFK